MRVFFLLLVFLFISISCVLAISNPAAVYCINNGYSYEIVNDANGNQYGICYTDSGKREEWMAYASANNKKSARSMVYSSEEKVIVENFSGASLSSLSENILPKSYLSDVRSSPLPSIDWRNINGGNFVSLVKNQGACGSCYVFSSVGVAESRVKIDLNNSGYSVNLSEQDVISCGNFGGCDGGFEVDVFNYIKNTGIVKESCFPYIAANGSCSNKCSNWQSSNLKANDFALAPASASGIKQIINDYGPITTYLAIWGDTQQNCNSGIYELNSYSSGVYTHTGGNAVCGWHSMMIVGYNDSGGYWIAKNSWGDWWGEDGFMRIDYSESVYDYDAWAADPLDVRTFFFDGSYYITSTDIINVPNISSSFSNVSLVSNSSVPINFSVISFPRSIKELSNVTLNNVSVSGDLTVGGFFSFIKTLGQLACSIPFGICSLAVNVTDDAGISSSSTINVTVSDSIYPNYTSESIAGEFKRYTNFSYNITLGDNLELSRAWFESNFSGFMQNYTYSLSGVRQNLNLSFNITGAVRSFSYRLGFNDSFGNMNYTTWAFANIVNSPPINLSMGNQSWVMNSNKTINLSQYFLDVDEDSLIFSNSSVSNINIIINQTSGVVILIPDFGFNGTRYINFSANDSTNITRGGNISLTVFRPVIIFNQTNFSSLTTNFSNLTNFVNISVFIERNGSGALNLSSASIENESQDLDSYINLSYNFISLNSSMLPGFNRSATLSLYNLSFSNPIIYRDGIVCSSSFCEQISYVDGTFVFSVSGFSNYTTLDAFCGDSVCSSGEDCSSCSSDCGGCASTSPAGGGGGGGGGGGAMVSFADSSKLEAGYLQKMSGGDRIIMDFENVNHSLYLNKVINNSVNITIKSDPLVLILNYGDEIRLNLTSIDYYDLYIRVDNVSGAKASIFVKKINESVGSYVSKTNTRGLNNFDKDSSSGVGVQVFGPVSGYIYVVVSIVVVFCLMIIFTILRMMHSKRMMKKKVRR